MDFVENVIYQLEFGGVPSVFNSDSGAEASGLMSLPAVSGSQEAVVSELMSLSAVSGSRQAEDSGSPTVSAVTSLPDIDIINRGMNEPGDADANPTGSQPKLTLAEIPWSIR